MKSMTQAPLPKWEQIAKLIYLHLSDDELAAPWLGDGNLYFWFSKSTWSLFSVVQAVRLQKSGQVCVWVPDYFCNAALMPLREIGVHLRFYPINIDLQPNLPACRKMLEQGKPDIFVLVHYMGQPVLSSSVYTFCKSVNACLVDDCAHVLEPVGAIGQAGDFVLYSLHKHFAIPDGALLVVRSGGPAQLGVQPLKWKDLGKICQIVAEKTGGNNIKMVTLWFIKRLLQCSGLRSRLKPADFSVIHSCGAQESFVHPKMSCSAKHLLYSMVNQINEIASTRQYNYQQWVYAIEKIPELTARGIVPLPVNATPYMAGFSAPDPGYAENIFHLIRHSGFPVTTWPDLPPEVLSCSTEHTVALHLRQTRFYLPVHQSLDFALIKKQGLKLPKYV